MKLVSKSVTSLCLIGLILGSCGEGKNTRKLDKVTGKQQVQQSESMAFYTNSTIGVSFKLPQNWTLSESENKSQVVINNKAVVGDSNQITSLEIALLASLNNKSITSDAALKSHLENEFPQKSWKRVQAFGKNGYFAKSFTEDEENGAVYVYDERTKQLLSLKYQTWFKQQAKAQLAEVMRAMLIDDKQPIIEEIKFIPDSAKPGDKVKLVIRASDEHSGINLSGFTPSINPYPINSPLLGYLPGVQDDRNGNGTSLYRYSQVFKVNRPFIQVDAQTFEYEFTVPANAPEGRISFGMVEVKDYYGNTATYTLGQEKQAVATVGEKPRFECKNSSCTDFIKSYHRIYTNPENGTEVMEATSLERADLVIATDNADHINDISGPEVKDIYFNQAFITKKASSIKLIVEFEDDSEIEASLMLLQESCMNRRAKYQRGSKESDYQKPKVSYNFVNPKKLDHNKFEISIDASSCYNDESLHFVYLESMIAFDKAGNERVIAFKGHPYFNGMREQQNFDSYIYFQLAK